MEIPTPPTARVMLLKLRLDAILPPGDPRTGPLLRLMRATDDVRYLQKRLIVTRERAELANPIERVILNTEIAYLFRLMGGHLYEAGSAFNGFEAAAPGRTDAAVTRSQSAKARLEEVRRAYDSNRQDGIKYSFLYHVRHYAAFHYPDEKFREAFEKHVKAGDLQGRLIVAPASGLGRFVVADDLAEFVIAHALGETLEEYQGKLMERVGAVIGLAGSLGQIVDLVVEHLLAEHPNEILDEQEGVVEIPPLVRRARDAVEAERKARLT